MQSGAEQGERNARGWFLNLLDGLDLLLQLLNLFS
jgi:hypothetical protein